MTIPRSLFDLFLCFLFIDLDVTLFFDVEVVGEDELVQFFSQWPLATVHYDFSSKKDVVVSVYLCVCGVVVCMCVRLCEIKECLMKEQQRGNNEVNNHSRILRRIKK